MTDEVLAGGEELPDQSLHGVSAITRKVAKALAEFRGVVAEPRVRHEVVRLFKHTREGVAKRVGDCRDRSRFRDGRGLQA